MAQFLNKQNILISVILPVYNAEKYLAQAIESILNQTYTNFEFIIINDGSVDDSLKIIQSYMEIDNRIVLINRENKGLVYSLNEGIQKAKGKYIARMDADDISLSDRFAKQIEWIEKYNLDICGSHYLVIDEHNNLQGLNLTPQTHTTCFLSLVSKVPFAHPNVMIRKSFLDIHQLLYGQSEYKVAEDLDLWIRMYIKGAKFGNVNDILFKYRDIKNSLSKVNNKGILTETKNMLNQFSERYKKEIFNLLKDIAIQDLNHEEKSIYVRVIFKFFIKKFKLRQAFKYLSKIEQKIVICTILSELKN